MSEHQNDHEDLSFGEKLLGLQGFSAVRARRYREELEKLLVHRISSFERWVIGTGGMIIGAALVIFGVAMAMAKDHPEFPGFDHAKLIMGETVAMTGLVWGGWLLRIGVQGGYGRRLGDVMGVVITLLFCCGVGVAFIDMAWDVSDPTLRLKLLLGGGIAFVVAVGSLFVAHLQRLHRQTQEKLLRIEYHLAELMERNSGSTLP